MRFNRESGERIPGKGKNLFSLFFLVFLCRRRKVITPFLCSHVSKISVIINFTLIFLINYPKEFILKYDSFYRTNIPKSLLLLSLSPSLLLLLVSTKPQYYID